MKKTLRKIDAPLPQVGAHFHVHLTGSGQLRARMEAVNPGSFGLMMSGVKSDIISLVHGPLCKQLVQYYDAHGTVPKPSYVNMNGALSDGNLDLEVDVRLTFNWELPGETRQDTASSLLATCFQFASAGVTRAEAILAAISTPAAHQPSGISQVASLPHNAMQHVIQQQVMQGSPGHLSIVARASSSDDGMGPGQYL